MEFVKTGVIGLGAVGAGMAMNPHKAGVLHRAWNRTATRAQEFFGGHRRGRIRIHPGLAAGRGDEDMTR